MSGLRTWAQENPLLAIAAIVFASGLAGLGIVFGTILLIVLAAEIPFALVVFLFTLLLAGGLAARSGLPFGDDGEREEPDPLAELERRYVRGEIDEEEFERRLSTILDADERAGRNPDLDVEFER